MLSISKISADNESERGEVREKELCKRFVAAVIIIVIDKSRMIGRLIVFYATHIEYR